jgi:alkanesulfonate monooxygenase SsuD/methylene tetrahydromethanopterin reductase-like flavin-dependent oxidoreductase (luciferase family)
MNLPAARTDDATAGDEAALPEEVDTIGVTGKIRVAIEAMIFAGKTTKEAAEIAEMPVKSLYTMLGQSRYAQAYTRALEVRRTAERSRNVHVAAQIRDDGRNEQARIAAMRFLEGQGERGSSGPVSISVNVSPGWVIDLGPERGQVIEHLPDDEAK